MIDHCLAALAREAQARRYRAYVAQGLKLLTENTARLCGGRYLSRQWTPEGPGEDGRSGDELAAEVIRRAGLKPRGL